MFGWVPMASSDPGSGSVSQWSRSHAVSKHMYLYLNMYRVGINILCSIYIHIYVPNLYHCPPPGPLLYPPVQGAEQGVPASCFPCPPPPPDTGSNPLSHAGALGTAQVQLNSREYLGTVQVQLHLHSIKYLGTVQVICNFLQIRNHLQIRNLQIRTLRFRNPQIRNRDKS